MNKATLRERKMKFENRVKELEKIQNAEPDVLEALPGEIQGLKRDIAVLNEWLAAGE